VHLLTGPNNEEDYTYVGKLGIYDGAFVPDRAAVVLTAKSAYKFDAIPYRIVSRVLAAIFSGKADAIEAAGWQVMHDGRCSRCRRLLTTPESLLRGMGSDCFSLVGK
jgi:hypothetical protein